MFETAGSTGHGNILADSGPGSTGVNRFIASLPLRRRLLFCDREKRLPEPATMGADRNGGVVATAKSLSAF